MNFLEKPFAPTTRLQKVRDVPDGKDGKDAKDGEDADAQTRVVLPGR